MALKDLRILRLQAENVKRIRVVEITPDGDLVTVTGKNGHGKTSVLDCILWALGGKDPIQWKPIRDGQERAFIQLDLGNDDGLQLQVTRGFIGQEDGSFTTSLKLVTGDGMRPQGEQTLLDTLIGSLSFDPGVFIRAKAADQVKILKGLIPGADFDAIAAARKKAFEARTDANREEKRLRGAGVAIPEILDLPPLVDTDALADELAAIGEASRAREDAISRRRRRELDAAAHYNSRDSHRARAERLRNEAADADAEADRQNAIGVEIEGEMQGIEIPAEPKDAASIRTALAEGEGIARGHERMKQRADLIAEADAQLANANALTAAIEGFDREVLDLVAGADLPVSGLSLQDDMVYLRGVPFDQASDAEQLRAALALGIASNPKLRVIRIRDGGLFDDDAIQVIREVASEENFQIWVEAVRGYGDPEEIVMENGEVKNG